MKARLTVREADTLKLEDLLDRLQEEKKRLIQRANKLTANGYKTYSFMCIISEYFALYS